MDAALGWIGDLIRALLSVVPRLLIVRDTYAGVAFVRGNQIRPLLPTNGLWAPCGPWWCRFARWQRCGIHVYWPLVTEYELASVRRQTTNLSAQYLCTSDRKPVGVSGIFVWEVADAVLLLTQCHDYEDTIRDLALAVIKEVVTGVAFDELVSFQDRIDTELTETLGEELRPFGVHTLRVTLTDLTPCRTLAIWGGVS
mgnify:CR=1 FL=1